MHTWLRRHRRLGKVITDWEEHHVIRPRAKWIATVMIIAMLAYPVIFSSLHNAWRIGLAVIGISVIAFIHSRLSEVRRVAAVSPFTTDD